MKLIFALSLASSFNCWFSDAFYKRPNKLRHAIKAIPYITSQNSKFGGLIEGASVNPSGHIFAVNFGNSSNVNQLGQVYPHQKLIFKDEYPNSFLNAIRFINSTTAFAADAVNHRILKLKLNPISNLVIESEVFCSHPDMIQPNDMVISSTGFIFTSGMRFVRDNNSTDGDIWRCSPNGEAKKLAALGRTNGIELSPKEDFILVSESYNKDNKPFIQRVWKYKVDIKTGEIFNPRLWIDFGKFDNSVQNDIDGMRSDMDGNLFITRHGNGEVKVFNSEAKNIAIISLNFPRPTNLEFGGPEGKTLYVVGQCEEFSIPGTGKGCVDYIELLTEGAGYSRIARNKAGAGKLVN